MILSNEPNSMFDDIEKNAMLQQIVGYANLVKKGKEILEGLEFEKIMREEKFRKRLESLNLK